MQLLVGLVSAYRYEGPRVSEEVARAEAKALVAAVKSGAGKLVENDEVVRILTTRSKPHLVETFKYYKEMHGKRIEEDLGQSGEETLLEAVLCLAAPAKYFSQVRADVHSIGIAHTIRHRRHEASSWDLCVC